MMDAVITLISATVSTLGFAIIFRVRTNRLVYATLCGFLASLISVLCEHAGGSVFVSCLLSALGATLFSELCARWRRAPSTVFLLPGLIPLVPGSSLYYTLYGLLNGDEFMFWQYAQVVFQAGFGISAGIIAASSLWSVYQQLRQRKTAC